jgi:LAS superfamily LD-carboxypeptidase LdcB
MSGDTQWLSPAPESAARLLETTGRCDSHVVAVEGCSGQFHAAMVADFQRLRTAAAAAGFTLAVASSFRSFERQLAIWCGKACGERPVLDTHGTALEVAALTPEQLLWAIARWSALPGASRHHWGTDIDVYDSAAVAADYRVQLVPAEYSDEGPFAAFSQWLEARIATDSLFGFYRPYAVDRGGVAAEPWHLSYRPVAARYAALLTPEHLLPLWREVKLPLLEQVELHQQRLFADFIACPD